MREREREREVFQRGHFDFIGIIHIFKNTQNVHVLPLEGKWIC